MGPEATLVLQLIIAAVFGGVCAAIAHTRGRSAVGWFFIGIFAPCGLGIILVLVLPDLKVQAEREERMRRENRRLRERLRKDRTVADRRHEATINRLDVHDDALGLDTGSERTRISEAATPTPPQPPAPVQDDGTEWYYLQGQERIGPVSVVRLHELWREARLNEDTLVWCAAMADWAEIRRVSTLRRVLGD